MIEPIENARTSHRHGKAWGLQDQGAIGPVFTPKQVWVGWVSVLAIVVAGAWMVWG